MQPATQRHECGRYDRDRDGIHQGHPARVGDRGSSAGANARRCTKGDRAKIDCESKLESDAVGAHSRHCYLRNYPPTNLPNYQILLVPWFSGVYTASETCITSRRKSCVLTVWKFHGTRTNPNG